MDGGDDIRNLLISMVWSCDQGDLKINGPPSSSVVSFSTPLRRFETAIDEGYVHVRCRSALTGKAILQASCDLSRPDVLDWFKDVVVHGRTVAWPAMES